jgi:hypothetical protein
MPDEMRWSIFHTSRKLDCQRSRSETLRRWIIACRRSHYDRDRLRNPKVAEYLTPLLQEQLLQGKSIARETVQTIELKAFHLILKRTILKAATTHITDRLFLVAPFIHVGIVEWNQIGCRNTSTVLSSKMVGEDGQE